MTFAEILAAAEVIKNENSVGKNTSIRIGTLFTNLATYFATNVSPEAANLIKDSIAKATTGLQKGMSVRWDLNLGPIPTGFVLNNGNGGVKINGVTIPDDRDRFTLGYNPAKAVLPLNSIDLTENNGKVGNTGGANSVTLKSSESGSPEKSIEIQLWDPWSDNGAAVFGSGEAHTGHANGKATITIPASNASEAHENRPLYITVCWITKVSDDTTVQYNSAYQSYVGTTTDNPILEEEAWVASLGGNGISAYEVAVNNGFLGTEAEWLVSLHGIPGYTPQKGTDYFDGDDGYTPVKGVDYNDGVDGASVPVNLAIFKPSANALALPVGFKWINNLTVTSVQLMSNCSGISVTIGANIYNQTTLIGITLNSGIEMIINDLIIVAGQNNANAIIIF